MPHRGSPARSRPRRLWHAASWGPSRAGLVKKRGAAIASILGADRPVYATPLENLRAAQAAAEELNGLGADELPYMTRRIQQLIDAAAERHEAGARAENTPRHPGRRLRAAPAQGKTRSRLLAAAGLESPSSATQKAARELWNDEATRLLLRLMGRDIPPRRLSRIRLSAAD